MDVQIMVVGSVICYLKNDSWHLVFVTDETHNAVLYINNVKFGSLRKPGVDQKIGFDFHDALLEKPKRGNGFSEILNIAGGEMHGKPVNEKITDGNAQMEIRRRKNSNTEIIEILIPGGRLDFGEPTLKEYYVKELGVNSQKVPLERAVAATIKVEIENINASNITLNFGDEKKDIFPPDNSSVIKLDFDNFCGDDKPDTDEDNDFRLYYDWLEDAENPGRRFIAGKLDKDSGMNEDVEMYGRQGNCDPISVDPPPTVGGS